MSHRPFIIIATLLILLLSLTLLVYSAEEDSFVYLPVVVKPIPPPTAVPTLTPTVTPTPTPAPTTTVEFRGLWVTRFDWTSWRSAPQSKIDEIVQNTADAGFNAIFFQVRGEADAYYNSAIEPWARRITGNLGQAPDPYWDPLAYFVQEAHAAGLELHAYMNIYPVWNCDGVPDPDATPTHFYYLLKNEHGTADNGDLNGSVWNADGEYCSGYLRASPASNFADEHYLAVAADIVNRYDVDGIHMDYIRYPTSLTSCDPVSTAVYGSHCQISTLAYQNWQRAQVSGTVQKFYTQMVAADPDLMLSTAVWFKYTAGYSYYYQDPHEWMQNKQGVGDGAGYVDVVSQMIYPSSSFDLAYWEREVTDMLLFANGRFVFPGIGGEYDCVGDTVNPCGSVARWQEIVTRIDKSRELGTGGHAIYSYNGLLLNNFFDDLADGPYATPAVVPKVTWRE